MSDELLLIIFIWLIPVTAGILFMVFYRKGTGND